MEGQYLAKALKWAVERWQSAGALEAGGPVTCSESFDTISLKKVRSGTVEQLKCPRTRVLVHIVS
jgi:hypothetical protein